MTRAKRIIALLVAVMLVAGFAGCGGGKEEEPKDDGLAITILYEQDDSMINNYSLLAVNPNAPFTPKTSKQTACNQAFGKPTQSS